MKRALVAFIGVLAVVGIPAVVRAHNAGHIFLPDGSCLEIGSFRDAPIVGKDRTQLDLVPETPNPPFDEYGVSFVGYGGNTPISPGRCPVSAPVVAAVQDSSGIPDFAAISFQ
jgi:hypothetical protein